MFLVGRWVINEHQPPDFPIRIGTNTKAIRRNMVSSVLAYYGQESAGLSGKSGEEMDSATNG
jgi:hypothetical protein